ncbi:cytochrome c [Lutimaribacter sp. EGI FJ00015]|uniref:Cytochrome c n=1 Tax=Lutimaribacter degradans TaxID=2945989 RepID=A0ACC5ZV54_9RHOB|nr:cytochrome c [Lutimaribacter sp. EGI FJ00013]MCM2562075.1 cytochrome c [Lutimaribacter sp. EGI FJ00013]MCO0613228.1 cytochrome c [Lutimaribacter sp. EGI FJ00015]MCO0636205.1 cytochrome c [Lutimaribacter sp. EGI FJ00014]
MSTRKFILVPVFIATASVALAQSDTAKRTVAALPETLEATGERAPQPVPTSSAEDISDLAPENLRFGIGRPATEEQIAAIDIDVMPDGRGYPEGSGTYAEGEELYLQECSSCHGENLEGVADLGAPRLIGGRGSLASDAPVKTVESYWPYASTLFDYVHRAMPMQAPGSLSNDQVYAISAYILGRAGITSDNPDTTLDKQSMTEVEMPNADGFVPDPRDGSPEK